MCCVTELRSQSSFQFFSYVPSSLGKVFWQYFRASSNCVWATIHLNGISHFPSNLEFTQELPIFHIMIFSQKNALEQTLQSI